MVCGNNGNKLKETRAYKCQNVKEQRNRWNNKRRKTLGLDSWNKRSANGTIEQDLYHTHTHTRTHARTHKHTHTHTAEARGSYQ